ncbi:MAG: TRAP transporter permease [Candidatus Methylomirabilota bacterium]
MNLRRSVITTFAVAVAGFHLYAAAFGALETLLQRVVHLSSLMALVFLVHPLTKEGWGKATRWLDDGLALLSLSILPYVVIHHERILTRAPWMDEVFPADVFFAIITMLLVLESCRRVVGGVLSLVTASFVAYFFLGPYLPDLLAHNKTHFLEFIDTMFLTTEGIFGIPIGASATYIVIFILFGAFLEATGAGQAMIDLAVAMVGKARGGPAKAAVISSAFFGTISGASVANVYGTGNFTIPLMKRVGYRPHFAGAVEAAASTGGQLMPPVMGSAAFIIAETLGITYLQVCVAAIIPSLFFFYSIGLATHLEAVKQNLPGVDAAEVAAVRRSLPRRLHLFLPPMVLVAVLVAGYSPHYSALWAVAATILVSLVRRDTRMGPRQFIQAMESGAKSAAMIAVATGAAGMIVGVIAFTGLGFKFMTLVLGLSTGNLFLALFFVMIAATILGMGVPTTPAYIIVAVIAAPSLIEMGVAPLVAHMFVFVFAMLSAVTPPVAVAGYAGANIAGADAMKTSFTAWRLCLIGFVIPYMFVYSPELLAQGSLPVILRVVVTGLIGVTAVGFGMYGWFLSPLPLWGRAAFLLGGLGLVYPSVPTDIMGLILIGGPAVLQILRRRATRR